ncbi:unnamed protein product [Rotaria sp. Silwood2]|nr:unnamed protein product [Rotaria sp. Silwood2]
MDNHNTSSILSEKENQTEEETINSDQLQGTSQISSTKNIFVERFNSSDIPMKPSGKSAAVIAIEENRKREKRELNHLNDRFASYIERVRFLEAQNKKFQLEIDQLREKWGSQITKVKEIYDGQISEARQIINDTAKQQATIDLRAKHAEEETLRLKEKCEVLLVARDSDRRQIELLQKQLFDNEADLDLFRRRLTDLEDEQKRFNVESKKLTLDIQQNRIRELEELVKNERSESIRASDERGQKIKELRTRLEDLARNYDELISTKISLDSEIAIYRKLLEGEEKREGLKQIVDNVEQQTRANFSASSDVSTTYSQSYQKQDDSQENQDRSQADRENSLDKETSYLSPISSSLDNNIQNNDDEPIQAPMHEEQPIPLRYSSFNHNNLKLRSYVPFQSLSSTRKESTIFEQVYGSHRRRPYTVSLNVQWAPVIYHTNIYEQSGSDFNSRKFKTQTFFETRAIREQEQSKAITTPRSDYTDAYLSAFAPKLIPTRYSHRLTPPIFAHVKPVPLERTKTYLSTNDSIKTSQTRFNNIQNSNSFDKTLPFSPNTNSTFRSNLIPNISTQYEPFSGAQTSLSETQTLNSNYSTSIYQPSLSKPPTTYQSEPSKENIDKPISHTSRPSTLLSSSLTTSSYKPSVLFQSAPLSFSNDIYPNSTNKQTVLPSSNIEKQIDRTETHLFQHDEDIRSSDIEKSLAESSIIYDKSKIDPEHAPTEELLTTSSKPIEILENQTNEYDSLINQISDILATVSPLSSTVSSMSPCQSVLDYELTADGSPILKRKNIEPQSSSQQPIVSVTNMNMQHAKVKYLIRDDSYDKIVTAMADLDSELTPVLPDIQKSTTPIEEEKNESIKTLLDEHKMLSLSSEQIQEDVKTSSLRNKNDEESEILLETSLNNVECVQPKISLLSNIVNNENLQEETIYSESYDEAISCKKNESQVTDDNILLNNDDDDDDDSSLYLSLTEEINSSKASIIVPEEEYITFNESKAIDKQQISTFDTENNQIITSDSTEPSANIIQRQIKSSSPLETSASFSDSNERRSTSSDIIESRSSHNEHASSSISSTNNQFISGMGSSSQNTFTSDKQSSIIPDVINKDVIDKQLEEIESNKIKTSTELIDDTGSLVRTSAMESTTLSLLPNIISPIDTLKISISTRYISSDVYHGYQGEHTQFIESPSDVNNDNTVISLLTSLRQTIKTPVTPLIETIQSVVSSMQTITAIQPLTNESEMIDNSQAETRMVTGITFDSEKDINEYETNIEENKQTIHTSEESNTVLKNLHNTVTEIIQAMLSNLQEEKQEVLLTSNTEQIKPVPEEPISIEKIKDLNIVQSSPPKSNVRSLDEIELTLSSLLDSIQEKVSDTITTFTETIQKVASTDVSSVRIQTPNEHIEASSSLLDTSHEKPINNLTNESINLISKTTIIKPIENQDNVMIESSSFRIPTQLSAEDRTTETRVIQHDEQASTESAVISECTNIQEIINIEPISFKITNVIPMNDQPFGEQITSTETIQNLSSLSNEKEQNLTDEQSKCYLEHQTSNQIDISFTTLLPQNELISDINKDDQIILKTIHKLIDNTIHIVISQLQENPIENTQEVSISDSNLNKLTTIQTDDVMQKSASELESDSISLNTEIENIQSKLTIDRCESSATNTEPDSLELVHTLQGHSIVLPNEPQPLFRPPEKSSSSTTSSQVTSSDHYISYAIHQMRDSSQERLPTIPLAADIPIYKNTDENIFYEPIDNVNQRIIKEDDSTEFDATENLTSFPDDIGAQKFYTLHENKQQHLETSSTDDDVDEEFEQNDLTNIHHIIDQLAQPNSSLNENDEAYQCYDLATSPSSNNSSSSLRQQSDDVYLIPGYPGLWRPSASNYSPSLPKEDDADDEGKIASENQTIIRTIDSTKRPLVFEYAQNEIKNLTNPEILTSGIPLRPDKIDLFNQSLNEYSLDRSETDSYQTCQSSISKHKKQYKLNEIKQSDEQDQTSPDESIFLIRERERGVSLPITMKIDCDDIALRLSTSTPIDSPLYLKLPLDLSSSSTHSEPPIPIKIDSNSRTSSLSSSSNENDQQKLPSWLNTVKTVITTREGSDGPLDSRITFLKSAKGPISISQCDPQGNYIMIENTSQSKNIDLSNWTISQENDNGDNLIFTFPDKCHLGPNHSLKILTKTNESEQRNNDLIASSLSSWHTSPNIITILYNSEGKVKS